MNIGLDWFSVFIGFVIGLFIASIYPVIVAHVKHSKNKKKKGKKE